MKYKRIFCFVPELSKLNIKKDVSYSFEFASSIKDFMNHNKDDMLVVSSSYADEYLKELLTMKNLYCVSLQPTIETEEQDILLESNAVNNDNEKHWHWSIEEIISEFENAV